jgi:hypothetical protein
MARLTARITRLETRYGARASDEDAHLTDAELKAQICKLAEKLTADWRDREMSVAEIVAETGRSTDDPPFAAMIAEAQAPEFNAARLLAALDGGTASSGAGEPDDPR